MKTWTKLLPFFLVELMARRWLSRNTLGGYTVVSPYKNVWLGLEEAE